VVWIAAVHHRAAGQDTCKNFKLRGRPAYELAAFQGGCPLLAC